MIDRLQHDLTDLAQLSPEQQEELALYIEALRDTPGNATSPAHLESAQTWDDPAGAWSDLPDDDEAGAFSRMRRDTRPSAPIEL